MLMRLNFILLIVLLPYWSKASSEESINLLYERLNSKLIIQMSSSNYGDAVHTAAKLLEIDPSDTVAYLSLRLSIKLSGQSCAEYHCESFEAYLSQSSPNEKRIFKLATSLGN
jgi:hypothetical protein